MAPARTVVTPQGPPGRRWWCSTRRVGWPWSRSCPTSSTCSRDRICRSCSRLGRPQAGATYREAAALEIETVLAGAAEALGRELVAAGMASDAYVIAAVALLGAPLWAVLL